MMEALKDRLPVIHIKDGLSNREGKPLGQGTAPVAAAYAQAVELNVPLFPLWLNWEYIRDLIVMPDGLTEAKICIDYLKSLEK